MTIIAIGIDLAKNVFAVHGVDEVGKAALVRPSVKRDALLVLDPCVRDLGAPGLHGSAGQRQARQERGRTQVRCAGLPVAAAVAQLWPAARSLPPGRSIELHQHDRLPGNARKTSHRNKPKFDLRTRLYQMCGVDLTRIDGIDVGTAMTALAEVGADMSKFPTVKHFAAWLGLCPGTKISGGKVLGSKTQKCANKTAQALRQAAVSLKNSQSALGAYYRRMCAKMDKPKAITAAAHKLARLTYTMITKGEEYVDQGQAYYEDRYRQRVEINLRRKAETLGLRLVPMEAA